MDLVELYPFQIRGAEFLAAHHQGFNADDMGLGKSGQGVCASDAVGAKSILVLCPASVRANWEREFERFSPMDRPVGLIYTAKDPIVHPGVTVCSYDLAIPLYRELMKREWDVLILDEAHFLKERTARRTKAVYGHGKKLAGIASKARYVWRLSGTPAPNWADELWTHLHSAGLTEDSYWDFTFRYCKGFDSNYGYRITGHKNVEELKALLAKFMIRRTKEEVMPELPPLVWEEVTIEPSAVDLEMFFYEHIRIGGPDPFLNELKVADQTLRQALAAVKHTRRPDQDRMDILQGLEASQSALRQYVGLAKLPGIIRLVQEELESGALNKIVLFAHHQKVIESARQLLHKFKPVTLYGATPPQTRQKNIEKFMNNPKCRVFIGNIRAAGVGIDGLQKVCHEVGFMEQDWTPGSNAQAAMRVHRNLQTEPVRVRVFSLHRSSDEIVQETLIRKARELCKIF